VSPLVIYFLVAFGALAICGLATLLHPGQTRRCPRCSTSIAASAWRCPACASQLY